MKKRILSFFIIFTILICNFSVVAFADGEDNNFKWWEFICSFFSDSYYIDNIAADPDQLINYWDTTPGKLQIINRLFTGANAPQDSVTLIPKIMAVNGLIDASERRCMVAELSRSQLQSIYDSFNDYWVNGSATVRNGNLEDYHLTLSNGSTLHSGFGTLAGAGPSILNGDPWNVSDRSRCISFVPSGSLSSGSGDVYIYNGSLYFPPVIFVTTYGSVLHNNQVLDIGIYIVLNGTQLLMVDSSYFNYKWCLFYSVGNDNHVGSIRRFIYNDSDYSTSQTIYKIINNGSVFSFDEYRYTPDFSCDDVLDLISNSIGNHIVIDGQQVDPINITIDDNVPFEDDKTVVVVPVDEPGEPVFLSPTEYNNYIDSHDIYDTDNTTNNIVNNDTVNNITNIYNTYITNNNSSSGYDDTNLMTKLDTIINKLSDIYNAIVNFSFADVDPCYENFSDCFFNHFTMLSAVRDALDQIDSGVTPNNVQLASSDGKTPEASGASAGEASEASSSAPLIFDRISSSLPRDDIYVNFLWFEPYRDSVRDILKFLAYGLGFISLFRNVNSIFGIVGNSNNDSSGFSVRK